MRYRTLRSLIVVGVVALVAAAPAAADTIYIPKIKLYAPIAKHLNDGPIKYWNDRDTMAIAGHRTTYSAPFYNLDKLRPGDLIRTGKRNYHVAKTVVIRPWETWVLNWKGLVLSACTPKGSASHRIVVLARLT